jgi:hypothetical protein
VKLKVVIVDLELPASLKRRALRIGMPLLIVCSAAIAYAAPARIWANGDALTAEDLNAGFANLDTRLSALEAGSTGKSAFSATKKVAYELPNLTDQVIVFDTELFDLANEYDPSTGIFTPKSGGYYQVSCSWKAAVTTKGNVSFYAEAGVGISPQTVIHSAWTGDGVYATRNIQTLVRLEAGAHVTCIGYHDATVSIPVALDLDSKFEAIRLAP